jgi:hypothetical protein
MIQDQWPSLMIQDQNVAFDWSEHCSLCAYSVPPSPHSLFSLSLLSLLSLSSLSLLFSLSLSLEYIFDTDATISLQPGAKLLAVSLAPRMQHCSVCLSRCVHTRSNVVVIQSGLLFRSSCPRSRSSSSPRPLPPPQIRVITTGALLPPCCSAPSPSPSLELKSYVDPLRESPGSLLRGEEWTVPVSQPVHCQ